MRAQPVEEAAVDAAASSSRMRVLVVDDVTAHQRLARCVFEALGCEVWTADDGLAAVEVANGVSFDLILMDRNMPRCDGDRAAQLIRASDGPSRKARIISHSSCPPTGAAARTYDGIIAKPARLSEVVNYVFPSFGAFRRRSAA